MKYDELIKNVNKGTKKLISEKTKGRVAPNAGKPHSEETKQKIREKRRQQCALKNFNNRGVTNHEHK